MGRVWLVDPQACLEWGVPVAGVVLAGVACYQALCVDHRHTQAILRMADSVQVLAEAVTVLTQRVPLGGTRAVCGAGQASLPAPRPPASRALGSPPVPSNPNRGDAGTHEALAGKPGGTTAEVMGVEEEEEEWQGDAMAVFSVGVPVPAGADGNVSGWLDAHACTARRVATDCTPRSRLLVLRLQECDELRENDRAMDAHNLLFQHKDSLDETPALLWRLARHVLM